MFKYNYSFINMGNITPADINWTGIVMAHCDIYICWIQSQFLLQWIHCFGNQDKVNLNTQLLVGFYQIFLHLIQYGEVWFTYSVQLPNVNFDVFQIISGYQIPKPNDSKKGEIIDPFIKIEVHGAKEDTQQCKTSVKNNNGNVSSGIVSPCSLYTIYQKIFTFCHKIGQFIIGYNITYLQSTLLL
jgi:hypothetical protein